MHESANANPTISLPSPFAVFSSNAPLTIPRFPRQCAQSAMAYRAACADRMAAWVRYVIDADPLLQPKATDTESMQHIKRVTAWRVLVRQAEIEAGRITVDERMLMETLSRAYFAQLEREAVSDLADRLADRAAEGEGSGYLVGPWAVAR
jgi:hypothetical protein